MAKTGESYTTARANLERPGTGPSPIEAFQNQMLTRPDVDRVRAHLESRYGIGIKKMTELDVGVFRVMRDTAPSWVARVSPTPRPTADIEGDAEILRFL